MSDDLQARPLAYSYIRMSTDIQLKGTSKQRQLDKSADYAKSHGLELVESHLDEGVSAFRGANVKGSLGRFLDDVRNEKIPIGSYLLVESLDRLSRQEPVKALPVFLAIINAGINVVTLIDGREYRASQTKTEDLMFSIIAMSRAHDESATKSQRGLDTWKNKRKLASAARRPLTSLCPKWLKLSHDRKRYELVAERTAVVKSIFEDTVAGIGSYVITRRLNSGHIPPFGRSKGWQRSYVTKILSSRAVIGEYQPCQIVDGKREPEGEPIKDYFPRVIDDEMFYRAQQSRKERRTSGRGRKGTYLTNLFSGLGTCAYCQCSMVLENKGPRPKGGLFLVCDGAKRGMGCVTTGWRYEHFESSFLAFVEKIDLAQIVNEKASDTSIVDEAIQAKKGELDALEKESERAYQLHIRAPDLEIAERKLREFQKQINELKRQIADKEAQKAKLERVNIELNRSRDEIKSLILRVQTPGDNDLYKLRSEIAARIKGLVDSLQIAPAGRAPKVAKAIQFLDSEEQEIPDKEGIIETMKIGQDLRYFLVGFKSGDVLAVYPKKDNPLEFERRVVATGVRKLDTKVIVELGDGSSRAVLQP